jgi:CDP-paratose 2-epimerase
MNAMQSARGDRGAPVLITGGGGFIGCNLADALAARGTSVLVLDNMSRDGALENATWLKQRHGDRITVEVADIRDPEKVRRSVALSSAVLHLAAQVAVTTSLDRPVDDFEINARGTLNVLEALRLDNPQAPMVFASTNKVYGRLLAPSAFVRHGKRYIVIDAGVGRSIAETAALDLYSPYGCSKGAADHYVGDYARVYGLRTAVLRMSCVYGPRQFGTEDQGWIAHFMLQSIRRRPITIFGDGLQVRDALHVDDAIAAWLGTLTHIDAVRGRAFNLGGGPENAVSLLELVDLIGRMRDDAPQVRFDLRRPGDQPWYITDTSALSAAIGWRPRVPLQEGLRTLEQWLCGQFGAAPLMRREVA